MLTWGLCVWTPRYTEFLHESVRSLLDGAHEAVTNAGRELHVGDVLRRAAEAGLRVEGSEVSDRPFLDIGSPEALARAVRHLSADG